jgi:hypothetical protein
MADGEDQGWLDDDTDPFADSTVSEQPSDAAESEHIDEPKADDSPVGEPAESLSEDEVDLSEDESTQAPIAWGLPIRAAPLLEENGEFVVEYPLKQSVNGRETTSIVVDEDLLRVVDTELGVDNHRRIKVKLTVKRDITGFSHQHNELMHQHQFLWIGCFIAGLCLSFVGNIAFGVLGALLMIIGVRSWVLMHLETHTLTFSSNGGSHQLVLRAYGTNRGFFRASMALIGPVMAGFIRNGEMETKELEQLHSSLLTPTPPVEPSSQFPTILHRTFPQAVQPAPPEATATQSTPLVPASVPAPPVGPPNEPVTAPAIQIPSPPVGPPTVKSALPPQNPLPVPAPVGPPLLQPTAPVGPPAAMSPPPPSAITPLPPAPLPPPMPLPPAIGIAPLPLPGGLPLPLDAPLPNAPEIAVAASPVEETLSEDEQNELLSDLS